jgi:hypothetical protein
MHARYRRHLEALGVIERDRPERVHRRRLPLVEMEDIDAATVKRLSYVVRDRVRLFRSFRLDSSNDCVKDVRTPRLDPVRDGWISPSRDVGFGQPLQSRP